MISAADRELLELAAKAVGWRNLAWEQDKLRVETGGLIGHNPEWFYWNPLGDDGDALRLAMKLAAAGKLRIHVTTTDVTAFQHWDGVWVPITWTFKAASPPEAFRRAIVRAAAEDGRLM